MPVVTLLTDYGHADEFVGVLHGVVLRGCERAQLIDLSHGVPPGDIFTGAVMLARALAYLPVGVHVAVVDPGVGTDRRAVAVRAADGRLFVGPDNGVLWPALAAAGGAVEAAEISKSPARLEPVSATFHGRDLFAPVAAALAWGRELHEIGAPFDPESLVRLELPAAKLAGDRLLAEVIGIDTFGNVQLSATADDAAALGLTLGSDVQVRAGHEVHVGRMLRTFADGADGELVVYADPNGRLTLALYRNSAAARLGLELHSELELGAGPCELLR